ncbi:hypothetical protein [Jeotgalibaca ciconiae]|uniref:Uncharacterized protein n=1 Tax=Jeotgalibaca ciconiae TaxID=2496265 RepID=A0A3S9HCC9_9LACT|nr:hypothetical protein [Jeotgalibaca ciconiae]AZP04961.1 hypothetical protein EJN90_10085 [Jeotgalibaca ciconiae]HJB24690.1 hypothetical protein [Candidatus Jeotgalibaca pullicola]
MYTNAFLGMDFTEDTKSVVIHFLMGYSLAEEYVFLNEETATHFYMACLRFFDAVKEKPVVEQQNMFRDFLDSNILELTYEKRIY